MQNKQIKNLLNVLYIPVLKLYMESRLQYRFYMLLDHTKDYCISGLKPL